VIPAVADVVLVVFASTAAWWDATTHRIPNKITVTGFAVALLLRAPLGLDVLLQGLAGAGIALLPAVVFYALGAIGGGDVKLLAAVGAFLGSTHIVGALALAAVLGAAFALGTVIRRGLLGLLLFNTLDLVKSLASLGQAGQRGKLDSAAVLTIPYGIPIALGALIWWFGKGVRL
jgi:prepilin peptidase CpaA